MNKHRKLKILESEIELLKKNEVDYISLTDISSTFEQGSGLISKWISNKNTLEYAGIWEKINNPNFNYPEFGVIEQSSGTNRFLMSVGQWIKRTNAIGMIVKPGRYGGTFAHKDIAFHFAMWLSPEFQIYLVNEFQRLKDDENKRTMSNWDLHRTIAKINYQIHTDAIKKFLIPSKITDKQATLIYANEADVINVALFGKTAKQWKDSYPANNGNLRDSATIEQLIVLSNLESINALLIHQKLSQNDRIVQLNAVAINQMKSLLKNHIIKNLKR